MMASLEAEVAAASFSINFEKEKNKYENQDRRYIGGYLRERLQNTIHARVIGQYDDLFCTPPQCPEAQVEPSYYSSDAQVEVKVIPNAGHMLNLRRNAPSVFATVLEWSNRRFGN
jgi:hypothetical protein